MEKFGHYINGAWVQGAKDAYIENINPSDLSDKIGLYAQADHALLDDTIVIAQKAQEAWAATGLEVKQNYLHKIGMELQNNADELGRLLAREEGKPFAEGRGEVFRAGQFFTYYAGEVLRQIGQNAQSVRAGVDIDVRREAVGVVAIISPWNFPMATACWKIAPALAFGNSVIWKPANLTPASAVALAQIFAKIDFPKGVFNMIMGSGSGTGHQLASSSEIDAVSFTGSLGVGQQIATHAAPNFTKIQLEMGSKNAIMIMADADLDLAADHAVAGAYGGTGQKCTASSRILVQDAIYDAMQEKILKRVKNLRVGHAFAKDTQLGPVASEVQLNENLAWIGKGASEGADKLYGGNAMQECTHDGKACSGYYMLPALFTGTNNMAMNQEELFAPIACLIPFADYEAGLAMVNDTQYGLTSGIMTKSLATANHFKQNSKTGCVMVNLPTAGTDYHVPFGGRKNSSYGVREQGQTAVEFYTHVKTNYIAAG